jgi:hypothetical protein
MLSRASGSHVSNLATVSSVFYPFRQTVRNMCLNLWSFGSVSGGAMPFSGLQSVAYGFILRDASLHSNATYNAQVGLGPQQRMLCISHPCPSGFCMLITSPLHLLCFLESQTPPSFRSLAQPNAHLSFGCPYKRLPSSFFVIPCIHLSAAYSRLWKVLWFAIGTPGF